MNKQRFLAGALAVIMCGAAMLTGCKKQEDETKAVYTTIAPVYDFTRKIAGDKLEVVHMAKGDVHGYEPSAADMAGMESAGLIIYNGLEIDSYVRNISDNLGVTFIDSSMGTETVLYNDTHGTEHYEGGSHEHAQGNVGAAEEDPHIWLYPPNAKIQMANIRDALIRYDSANAEYYRKNYETYAAGCDDLDAKFRSLSGKTIVTTHNAYGYWKAKYGINVVAMDTAGEEISPARMREIVEFCKQNGITTVYYEASGSDKNAQAVASEIGGTVKALNSFEAFVNDGDDYFSVMEQNYEAMK